MKDKTFKLVSKFFITLGVIYWVCLILAATTGCKTEINPYATEDERLIELWKESRKYKDPNETTINLDPMDKTQWHEREEFLRHFD